MYKLAFDLGTTTIVGYLCNTDEGKIIRSVSEPSAQIECGLDVLARASYKGKSKENAGYLADLLGDQVCRMTNELLTGVSDASDEPAGVVLVGNPVIMGSIAGYDFGAHGIEAVRIPGIGHYVGADALAASYVAEEDRKGKNIIVVDIGTNTEIVLLSDEKKTATSAAAGTALAGGHVSCGM